MSSNGYPQARRLPIRRTLSGRFRIRNVSDLNPSYVDQSDSNPESDYGGSESLRDSIDAIFRRAMEEEERENSLLANVQRSSSSTNSPGNGRLISGEITTVPHRPFSSSTGTPPSVPEGTEVFYYDHDLTFWRNGIIVDEEMMWKYTDEGCDTFVESLKNGVCPDDITPANLNDTFPIIVCLRRRHARLLETPVSSPGVDRTLSSSSSSTTDDDYGLFLTLPLPEDEDEDPTAPPPPSMSLVVDQSLPSTSIQLRLANGAHITGRFNLHHTVGDIRSFIDESTPGSNTTYQLLAAGGIIPPRVLTDPTQTIEQAGLAGSFVFQLF